MGNCWIPHPLSHSGPSNKSSSALSFPSLFLSHSETLLLLPPLHSLIQGDPLYLRAFQLLKIGFLFPPLPPSLLSKATILCLSSFWLQHLEGQDLTWGQPGLSWEPGSAELHFMLPLKFYPGNGCIVPPFASRKSVTISGVCPLAEQTFMMQGWDILAMVVVVVGFSDGQMHQK